MGIEEDITWARGLVAMYMDDTGTAPISIEELEQWIVSPQGYAMIAYDPGEETEIINAMRRAASVGWKITDPGVVRPPDQDHGQSFPPDDDD